VVVVVGVAVVDVDDDEVVADRAGDVVVVAGGSVGKGEVSADSPARQAARPRTPITISTAHLLMLFEAIG
jgi:hypothetical protein